MNTGRRPRGQIAAVLLTAVLALALLFTVAAGAVSHLRFTRHSSNAQRARNMADAAVETAIAHLRQDLRFGQTSGLLADMAAALVSVSDGPAHGRLSFHAEHARQLGIPVSLNNVESDASRQGWGDRVIPAEAVQLVAVGECAGVKRTVEVVLHVPRFPYIVSCSGPFVSEGPLTLGVVPREVDPAEVTADQLLPGHLVSNSSHSPAVELKGETVVSGDVEAVGSISTVAPAIVRGHTKSGASEAPLAKLRITDYDPMGRYALVQNFPGGQDEVLSGYNRSPLGQPVVEVDGDLRLEAGVLYVDGSILVKGGVKGKGALIATGGITIEETTALEADQQVALVSQGNITLNGSGSFRGLIYTEGNLNSAGVQLTGALITNGPPNAGRITLVESGLVAGEPNMSFEEGWLCESTARVAYDETTLMELQLEETLGTEQLQEAFTIQLPSGQVIPPPPPAPPRRLEVNSRFLRQQPDGLIVVEWIYHLSSAAGPAYDVIGSDGRTVRLLDYYDQDGNRVRAEFSEGILTTEDGEILTLTTPPPLAPVRVERYVEMQEFKLDFSQFLRPEEDLRILLRAEH